ncbi:MAG TPA: hypothetical protein VFE62_21930 [Gemmataceae bacterium]|nr:hypothetical protein [Gemmataceae bacterium]
MMNFIAKGLVLFHTVISILAMTWAVTYVLVGRDFGWAEPRQEATEYDGEGNAKAFVRYASEIDKSQVALLEAKENRDLTYVYVKPAIDQFREAEPYLANNHLHYRAEMERLDKATGPLKVKDFKDGGNTLDTPTSKLGKPALEDKDLDDIKKSYESYGNDMKSLYKDIAEVENDLNKISVASKKIVADLTGTDEANKYVQPGLYDLVDLEFKAQTKLKQEIDDIKPYWSRAIQNAQLYRSQRDQLENTLKKLKKK